MNQAAIRLGKMVKSVRKASTFTFYATGLSKISYSPITDLFDD